VAMTSRSPGAQRCGRLLTEMIPRLPGADRIGHEACAVADVPQVHLLVSRIPPASSSSASIAGLQCSARVRHRDAVGLDFSIVLHRRSSGSANPALRALYT
jgi:hypothetical protein